jgi:hypothetical protein
MTGIEFARRHHPVVHHFDEEPNSGSKPPTLKSTTATTPFSRPPIRPDACLRGLPPKANS